MSTFKRKPKIWRPNVDFPWLGGITLPPFGIIIEEQWRDDEWLLRHEYGHWLQYEDWGWFKFVWVVLTEYIKDGRRKAAVEYDANRRGQSIPEEDL